jgi:hypothetical protein
MKINNLLLVLALISGTLAIFFTGVNYENKSQQTLAIAQQLDLTIRLLTEQERMSDPILRQEFDDKIDQLIIMGSQERTVWWLKPCTRKSLDLSLLRAFQYRGIDAPLSALRQQINNNSLNTYLVGQCEASILVTEAAYAKLVDDPAYDPLIQNLSCLPSAAKVTPVAHAASPELILPPIPEDFDLPN